MPFEPEKLRKLMLSDPAVNMSQYLDPTYENISRIRENAAQAHFARMANSTALEMIVVGDDETLARKLMQIAADFAGEWLQLRPPTEQRLRDRQWLFDAASSNEVVAVERWLAQGEFEVSTTAECARWNIAYLVEGISPRTKMASKSDVLHAMWALASVAEFAAISEVARVAGRELEGVSKVLFEASLTPEILSDRSHPTTKAVRRELGRRAREFATTDWGFAQVVQGLRFLEWRSGSAVTPRESMLRLYSYVPAVKPPECLRDEIARLNVGTADG